MSDSSVGEVDYSALGDGVIATTIAAPTSVEALKQEMARLGSAETAIYPQGGRTALDFGGIPRHPGAAIRLTGLDRVIDYPAADMTITVEAGIGLTRLQSILAEKGQHLPLDPPQAANATLGGIFATNASGPKRFGHGRPRDLILGVEFLSAQGELLRGGGRVVKNVAGYDFPKLLTGSLGTLGVITQMTLKVRPLPEERALVWARYERLDAAWSALERLNTSVTRPVALELLNARMGKRIEELGGPSIGGHWALALGFEGNRSAVDWQIDMVRAELAGGTVLALRGNESDPSWSALREVRVLDAPALSVQFNAPPSALVEALDLLEGLGWCVQARAGSGELFAFRSEVKHADAARAADDVARICELARRIGGSAILPHCPTDWKPRLKVWGDPRSDWAWMERIKNALDPRHLLNPGRFVATI